MRLRVHRILPKTEVEGPGTRFCIWVQGCPIHCMGCGAKETWSFDAGELIDVETIYNMIVNTRGIEGVTFLGGEPFAQAEAIYQLASMTRKLGLTVVTFTGYTYEYILNDNRKEWMNLISATDLLIDGPFEEDKFELSRPWLGSSNQNYRFLTSAYKHLENNLSGFKNKVEVMIKENGAIFINGMGDFNEIKRNLINLRDGD